MKKRLTGIAVVVVLSAAVGSAVQLFGQAPAGGPGRGRRGFADVNANLTNLALVAIASASFVSPDQTLSAINDGNVVNPATHYGNWPNGGTQWIEYRWPVKISTNKAEVFWYQDGRGLQLPAACRITYWNGTDFVPVANAQGLGVAQGSNVTTFDEVTTDRIRLEMDAAGGPQISTGVNEFRVFDSGKSPAFPPVVSAGHDRVVIEHGKTYLAATIKPLKASDRDLTTMTWSKEQGPGDVRFAGAGDPATTATFETPGEYVLKFTAALGKLESSDTVHVRVDPPAPETRLEPVQTSVYKLDSPFWQPRIKAQIVNWIPHVVDYLEHEDKHMGRGGAIQGSGGIDNFIEAGKKLRGEPAKAHQGYPFANAYVYNTVEAMCNALMVDPQGDAEIIKAQNGMKETLDQWIPIILAAQEPDGYIQTRFTLNGGNHWDPRTRGEHEGYTMGYFLEAAIAHYNMTQGKDLRLYNAAKKCADCWVANIGPGKKTWYDGHQEMEQSLVRFSRLVDQVDGADKGKPYVQLAKFLLDSREGGQSYDQSHLPVVQQYEVMGHAVRAAYTYTGMASVAAEFHDVDYESATKSLWDDLINRKIYVTGGIGSGDTSEGFGPDFALRNNSYCESCSNCGELFFQYNMLLNYHDAKYVDTYETTLYNAIVGDNNLEGTLFEYTNPLIENNRPREAWDQCPCCVGNIPRTLLALPTWTYSTASDALYVNLFIGGTMHVPNVAGTPVEVVQKTNYPWDGKVAITVNPNESKPFTLKVRVPNRQVGTLYQTQPEVQGLSGLTVNGVAQDAKIVNGYAEITRSWKPGDTVAFTVPMEVQRVHADARVAADRGMVALRYGPLVYNVESADGQDVNGILPASAALSPRWVTDLLGGVMTIRGKFADGSDLTAIPNYARNNRGGRSQVWIREQ